MEGNTTGIIRSASLLSENSSNRRIITPAESAKGCEHVPIGLDSPVHMALFSWPRFKYPLEFIFFQIRSYQHNATPTNRPNCKLNFVFLSRCVFLYIQCNAQSSRLILSCSYSWNMVCWNIKYQPTAKHRD